MPSLTRIPRAVWRPAPRVRSVVERDPESIKELFIHWPGGKVSSPQGRTFAQECEIMRSLQAAHIANGWADIGYNFVLFPRVGATPRVYTARGARYIPAAQLNHNTGTLAIMVYTSPGEELAASTAARLRSFVRWADGYAGRTLAVRSHSEVVSTQCPGPQLRAWVQGGRHR